MEAVVFNQYSVQSCIMAALYGRKDRSGSLVPVQFNRLKTVYDKYVWCDVSPSNKTVLALRNKTHTVPGQNPLTEDDAKFAVHGAGLEYFIPELSGVLKEEELFTLWDLVATLSCIKNKRGVVLLEDIASLYCNHQAALQALYSGNKFELVPNKSKDDIKRNTEEYRKVLQFLCGKINADMVVMNVEHRSVIQKVPVLNLENRLFPWAERLISFTYSSGILYEVSGNEINIHTWNTEKSTVDRLIKTVEKTMLAKMSIRYIGVC